MAKRWTDSFHCSNTRTVIGSSSFAPIKQLWWFDTFKLTLQADPTSPLLTYSRSCNLKDRLVYSDAFDHLCVLMNTWMIWLASFHVVIVCHEPRSPRPTSYSTGNHYNIRKFITCNSTSVVYLLYYLCGLQYTCCTRKQLRVRLNEHCSAINKQHPKSPVAWHFSEANHSVSDLKFIRIDSPLYPQEELIGWDALSVWRMLDLLPKNITSTWDEWWFWPDRFSINYFLIYIWECSICWSYIRLSIYVFFIIPFLIVNWFILWIHLIIYFFSEHTLQPT